MQQIHAGAYLGLSQDERPAPLTPDLLSMLLPMVKPSKLAICL